MDIQKIKKLYEQNQNLTEYFKTTQNKNCLNSQEIELIYDLQSGNYSKKYENNKAHKEYKDKFSEEIVNYLNSLNFKFDSILEAGIGEGTTFVNIIQKLNIVKLKSFGVDISWSRLAYANKFFKKHSIKNVKLVTGLLENLPFLENSIDIVYTAHSIEPNGGKEKEILKELFRVTKNYLILLEPSYEFGNDEQKERMDKLSYAKNLSKYCEELRYKIIKHELLKNHSVENNKTEIIIIEKSTKRTKTKDFLACPETKTKLFKNKNFYYSAESFYSYPILENIICLNSENKILSTKLENFIKLDKTHPRYNEQMFLKSLEEPMDEKIKDIYCPNCIGFLATEENLEDEEFVGYIKELMRRFPDVEFKGFCFSKKQILKIKNLDIQIVHIISYTEIIKNISIFITPLYLNNVNSLLIKLIITNSRILINYYSKEFATKNIDTFNKELESDFMRMRKYSTIYKFLDNEVINAQNYLFLVFKTYMNRVNDETLFDFTSLKELLYFQTIACALVSPEFPKYMSHLRNTDIKLLGTK